MRGALPWGVVGTQLTKPMAERYVSITRRNGATMALPSIMGDNMPPIQSGIDKSAKSFTLTTT